MKGIVRSQKVRRAKLQRAKELRQGMTPEEEILWKYLRTNKLDGFHFRRQQIIDGFIVDFYCNKVGLVVEVDGQIHEQQVEYDEERDRVLTARRLHVMRIKNDEVRNDLANVLTRIHDKCCALSPLPSREGVGG